MPVMRCLRSYRFILTLCFTTSFVVFIYRFNGITRKSSIVSRNILSSKINERLLFLEYQFHHVNISMLLHRPSSNQPPSITYRCQEWCGGCKSIKNLLFHSTQIIFISFKGVIVYVVLHQHSY
jgi:hypothetical protein